MIKKKEITVKNSKTDEGLGHSHQTLLSSTFTCALQNRVPVQLNPIKGPCVSLIFFFPLEGKVYASTI